MFASDNTQAVNVANAFFVTTEPTIILLLEIMELINTTRIHS